MPTISDYIFNSALNLGLAGIYVGFVNNLTAAAYKSNGTIAGLFTASPPPGTYTLYISPTGSGLPPGGDWVATGDTNYIVPIRNDANIFWDEANNRLGLGTTTPGSKLDLGSTGLGDGAQANSRVAFFDDGTNISYVTFDGTVVTRFKSSGEWRFTSVGTGAGRFAVGTDLLRITAQGHLVLGGSAPALGALQAGVSSQSISGTDARGTLILTTTGAAPGQAALIAIINYATTYAARPASFFGALDTLVHFFAKAGSNASTLNVAPDAALANTTTYTIDYESLG